MLKPHKMRFPAVYRHKYGCDEWLPIGLDAFVDVPLSTLRRLDAAVQAAIGVKLYDLLRVAEGVSLNDMETQAVVAWLALQINRPGSCEFPDFDVALIGIDRDYSEEEPAGGDVDPPVPSSAEASAETPPPAKPKRSRPGATSKR